MGINDSLTFSCPSVNFNSTPGHLNTPAYGPEQLNQPDPQTQNARAEGASGVLSGSVVSGVVVDDAHMCATCGVKASSPFLQYLVTPWSLAPIPIQYRPIAFGLGCGCVKLHDSQFVPDHRTRHAVQTLSQRSP